MLGLRTSRFGQNNNTNKIALNLFQGDINDFNDNDEYEDILTKRGKVKNREKIEYFKNYINNFKEIKFKTTRPIEIFKKKEERKVNNKKEKLDEKKNIEKPDENISQMNKTNNTFNKIKENIGEGRQIKNLDINDINNEKNEIMNNVVQKKKKTKKEITKEIIKKNEDILNKIKMNKNMAKFVEIAANKIMKSKNKEHKKKKNLSTEKDYGILEKDRQRFLNLIMDKKKNKMKEKINKSFNNSCRINNYFNNDNFEINTFKTVSNENTRRKMKEFRNNFIMEVVTRNKCYNSIKEKEIFNKKCKNIIKAAKYLSRSCSKGKNKSKNISDKNSKESNKIIKTRKKNITKRIKNKIPDDIKQNKKDFFG